MSDATFARRLRLAAALVMAGLGVELFSFRWHHPTAFIVFFVVGGTLLAGGILTYLYSILRKGG